jgi:hypothetical protein
MDTKFTTREENLTTPTQADDMDLKPFLIEFPRDLITDLKTFLDKVYI